MGKKKTGKRYEKFVESIYQTLTISDKNTIVEHDVNVKGHDGTRQIDLLIKSKVADHDLITVVECRDYKSRLDVTHVDGFHSKMIDINANKGVLVTTKGFSLKAKNKANRLGITLCLAADVNSVLKEIKSQIPVKASNTIVAFELSMEMVPFHESITFDLPGAIKHIGMFKILHKQILNGEIKIPYEDDEPIIIPTKDLNLPLLVKDEQGKKLCKINDIKVKLMFKTEYYYGLLNDLPDLVTMHRYDANKTTFIFENNDYINVVQNLTKYDTESEIPSNYAIRLKMYEIHYKDFIGDLANTRIVDVKHEE